MAKSSRSSRIQKQSQSAKHSKHESTVRNSRTTVSGPARPDTSGNGDVSADDAAATQDVALAIPFNPNKAAEYDPDATPAPPKGASVTSRDPIAGASTVAIVAADGCDGKALTETAERLTDAADPKAVQSG
jgi:catalase